MESAIIKTTPSVVAGSGKTLNQFVRVGRGIPDVANAYHTKCSCTRMKTIVYCRACGFYCKGRIRIQCSFHPRVSFLLDLTECPRCHSSTYLDESL